MTDEITGSESETPEAPATAQAPVANDEVTVLRSRLAGQDAKITELTKASQAAIDAAASAAAKLADYETGKVGADEALRAQLAAKDQELAAERRATALAKIEAAYPETFAVLGEAAFSLDPAKLAEAEARFRGVAPAEDPATPRGNNGAKPVTPAKADANKGKSFDDLVAEMKAGGAPNWA